MTPQLERAKLRERATSIVHSPTKPQAKEEDPEGDPQEGRSLVGSILKFVGKMTTPNILKHLIEKDAYLHAKFSKIFDVHYQRINNLANGIKTVKIGNHLQRPQHCRTASCTTCNDRRTAANRRTSFPTKIATVCYARHFRHIRSRFQKLLPKTRTRPTYAIATTAYAAAYASGSRCFYAPTAFVMYQASTPI